VSGPNFTCYGHKVQLEYSINAGEVKPLSSNIIRMEARALRSFKQNKEIRILLADKGNCMVVLNNSTHKRKISGLLDSRVYIPLYKDPTFQIERKIQKLLSEHKTVLPTDLKHKLTPYHIKSCISMDFLKYTKQMSPSD
jgi:hypothetical protein